MDILSKLHNKLLFTPQDVAQITGNMRSTQTLLLRYQQKGVISKIRRGLYCVNNLATCQPEANKFQIACAITPSSYIAYHAAMEYHGLAHQMYFNVDVGGEQPFNSFEFDSKFTFFLVSNKVFPLFFTYIIMNTPTVCLLPDDVDILILSIPHASVVVFVSVKTIAVAIWFALA